MIAQRLHSPPPTISQRRAGVPRWLSQAIARAMAIDPHDRFRTAGELAEALSNPARSGNWLTRTAARLLNRALLLSSGAFLLGGNDPNFLGGNDPNFSGLRDNPEFRKLSETQLSR